jgi:hypothetical protein
MKETTKKQKDSAQAEAAIDHFKDIETAHIAAVLTDDGDTFTASIRGSVSDLGILVMNILYDSLDVRAVIAGALFCYASDMYKNGDDDFLMKLVAASERMMEDARKNTPEHVNNVIQKILDNIEHKTKDETDGRKK